MYKEIRVFDEDKIKIGDCLKLSVKIFDNKELIFKGIVQEIDVDLISILAKNIKYPSLFNHKDIIIQDPSIKELIRQFIVKSDYKVTTYSIRVEDLKKFGLELEIV